MSETTNKEEAQREPTPEEIKAYRAGMMAFYKEETPLLKTQNEYEKLKADIDENRLRSLVARIRYAQATAPPPSPETKDPGQDAPKEERKLKTE